MILIMTASAFLSTATISTRASSSTASYVSEQLEEGRRHLLDSHSLGMGTNAVMEKLYELAESCRLENWDGQGAIAVGQETFRQAYRFIEALPLGSIPPSLGVEPDGQITLEWYKSTRKTLSISISPEGDLHYSAIVGLSKSYGTEAFFGEIPKPIFELLNRVLTA
jgi:hypothetical protein